MSYNYNFPRVTVTTTPYDQAEKIREEVGEFRSASHLWSESSIFDPLDVNAAIELLDIQQAVETMAGLYNPAILEAAAIAVEAKNRARGYYDYNLIDDSLIDDILDDLAAKEVDND